MPPNDGDPLRGDDLPPAGSSDVPSTVTPRREQMVPFGPDGRRHSSDLAKPDEPENPVYDLTYTQLHGFIKYYAGEEVAKILDSNLKRVIEVEVEKRVNADLSLFEQRALRRVRAELATVVDQVRIARVEPAPTVVVTAPATDPKPTRRQRLISLFAKGFFGLAALTVAGAYGVLAATPASLVLMEYMFLAALAFAAFGVAFELAID
jgi:hypothetical protein